MDAFFAAVEQRDNPSLRGRAIAVGHSGRRGVVSTASYEARPYGVRSALPSVVAQRLCPNLIFVEPRFDAYKAVSEQIRAIFHQYTDLVEPLSLDEAFLDVTHHPSATIVAKQIKEKIYQTTQLTASAGVSVNKMLAKIASDYRKPNGLFVIPPKDIEAFVSQLPIEKFFGIGEAGALYYGYARGIDNREVTPNRVRKSLGAESTFIEDIDTLDGLEYELSAIQNEVWARVKRHEFYGKTVVLKVKYNDFQQITRSKTLPEPIDTFDTLYQVSRELLEEIDISNRSVRLLGLTVGNNSEPCTESIQLRFDFDHQ